MQTLWIFIACPFEIPNWDKEYNLETQSNNFLRLMGFCTLYFCAYPGDNVHTDAE